LLERRRRVPRRVADLARLEPEVVGREVLGRLALDYLARLRRDRRLERVRDLLRELPLDREDVGQVAVVGLGPDVLVGRGADQLTGHPHLVAGAPYAALEDVGDAELLADLADRLGRGAGLHDRRARNDPQLLHE